MKRRLLIVMGVIIALILGGVIWNSIHVDQDNLKDVQSLELVSVYLQEKGADYAVDRLNYLIVYSYNRDDLVEAWGTPSESMTETNADAWILSDENQLVVRYDTDGEIAEIGVQSLHH